MMERTRAGLQAARRQGRVGARKRQMTDSKIQAGLLQLAAFSFRTIKSWSRFAGDFRSPTSKCSAKIARKSVFVLLKHKIWGFTL